MAIKRMNHAVLYVRDAEKSADFYKQVLGFSEVFGRPGARFLRAPASANDHDLGLFSIGEQASASSAGRATVGLYHLAWEVSTLGELQQVADRLQQAGALYGATDHVTTKSVYARDLDGIEFEVMWMVPPSQLREEERDGRVMMARLDLAANIQRFGADLQGGPET